MSRNSRIRVKKARENKTTNPNAKKVYCGEANGVKIYAVFNK